MSPHGHPHPGGDRRLVLALGANVLLTVVEIVAGALAGSLALVADAVHNLHDAAALGVALVARRIARRPADERRTYGYRRAEVVGALINLTALVLLGAYLIFEAVLRLLDPHPVEGAVMIAVAGVALLVDVGTALLTLPMARRSLNVRAAFLHNVADALASVGVIAAGLLVVLFGLVAADGVAALAIAAFVLWHGIGGMRTVVRILMKSMPPGLRLGDVVACMQAVEGVRSAHQVRVWQLDEHHRGLEAHVVVHADDLGELEAIKGRVKEALRQRFDIEQSTLEFETEPADSTEAPGTE